MRSYNIASNKICRGVEELKGPKTLSVEYPRNYVAATE